MLQRCGYRSLYPLWSPAQCLGHGRRQIKEGSWGWEVGQAKNSSAAVAAQVGGLTDCTQPGSGLEWRPPALAGLESLLGVAGGRCTLLARQVLVAGSTHRGSGLLATTTVKAFRALPNVPTLHRRPGKRTQLPTVCCLELANTVTWPLCHAHSLCTRHCT